MKSKVGIVVPTLGTRPEFLKACLESIKSAGNPFVLVIGPRGFDGEKLVKTGLADKFVIEAQKGLAHSINQGIHALPKEIKYANWLGDDDLLTPHSLEIALERLEKPDRPVLVFGACKYIDTENNPVWTNKSGQWAVPLLRFGPDLIPQPGALFSRLAFEAVNGLDSSYGWAFDFDLFIKLSKIGKIAYIPKTLSNFRWHLESLSVNLRKSSVAEASSVRISHLPRWLRPICQIWEWPVRKATYLAGKKLPTTTT